MRKSIRYLFFITIALVFSGLLLAGPSIAGPKEIPYGAIIPLSGPAAPWGILVQSATNVVLDQINAAGGITVNGKKYIWKLAAYDSAMDPSQAITAMNRLIHRDKCKFGLVLGNDCTMATQPISEPNKFIQIGLNVPSKSIMNPKNPYTFNYGMDALTDLILYPWVEKNMSHIKNVALLHDDTANGHATAALARAGIEKTGLTIIFDEYADPATSDFYPVLTRLLAKKPDFLACANWDPATGAHLLRQARELGFKGSMHLVTPDIATLKEVAGWENCEGIFLDPYVEKPNLAMNTLKEEYIKRYGEKEWPGPVAYTLIDYPYWLKEAIEATQSFDTATMIKYLATAETKSIWGEPAFMGGTSLFGIARNPVYPVWMGQVQKGKVVQVISGYVSKDLK